MRLESSWLVSRRSRFRPTRSPSGALPGPTSSTLYGPVQQCASFDTNVNDFRDDPSAGAFRICLPPPLIVVDPNSLSSSEVGLLLEDRV